MKRALIFGASGGIGAAFCDALGQQGYAVTGLSRSGDGLDLRDPAAVDAAMASLSGPFDLVVIATGILAPPGASPEKSLRSIDQATMQDLLLVNAVGPALILSRLPALLPREGRSVVAVLTARVGSIGDNHLGGWYSYRASKAAANQITRTAAIELQRKFKECRVVALHPGTVDTAFTAGYPNKDKHDPATAAQNLLRVIDGLEPEDNGGFFDWRGEAVPW